MQLVLFIWAIYAGVAGVISLPIVLLGRNRVRWYAWELLAFVLPFCVWLFLTFYWRTPSGSKSWGNFEEPLFFALAVPLAALIRVIGGRANKGDERMLAGALLGGQCFLAVLVYFLTPNLGGTLGRSNPPVAASPAFAALVHFDHRCRGVAGRDRSAA